MYKTRYNVFTPDGDFDTWCDTQSEVTHAIQDWSDDPNGTTELRVTGYLDKLVGVSWVTDTSRVTGRWKVSDGGRLISLKADEWPEASGAQEA